VTEQTDANLLHKMMQCLTTKNENENNVQINPKILSLVYTEMIIINWEQDFCTP